MLNKKLSTKKITRLNATLFPLSVSGELAASQRATLAFPYTRKSIRAYNFNGSKTARDGKQLECFYTNNWRFAAAILARTRDRRLIATYLWRIRANAPVLSEIHEQSTHTRLTFTNSIISTKKYFEGNLTLSSEKNMVRVQTSLSRRRRRAKIGTRLTKQKEEEKKLVPKARRQ